MDHDLKSSTNYVYQWMQQISSKSAYLNLSKYVQQKLRREGCDFVLQDQIGSWLYVLRNKRLDIFAS